MFLRQKGSSNREQKKTKEKEIKMRLGYQKLTKEWEPTGTGTGFYSVPFETLDGVRVCYMTNKVTRETAYANLDTGNLIPWDKVSALGV